MVKLEELGKLLSCPICHDFISTAMIIPRCSHTYCSVCIRRYICHKTQCPSCLISVTEPELVNNRLIDKIKDEFLTISQQYDDMKRQTKLQTERGLTEIELKNNHSSTNNGSDNVIKRFSRRPPNKRVFVLSDSSDEENELSNAQSKVPQGAKRKNTSKEDMSSPFKSMKLAQPNIVSCMSPAKTKLVLTSPKPQLTFSQPGTPARNSYSSCVPSVKSPETSNFPTSLSGFSSPKSQSALLNNSPHTTQTSSSSLGSPKHSYSGPFTSPKKSSQSSQINKKVPCPICNVDVLERCINLHLDSCLNGRNKLPPPTTKRKTLPKLVYNLMKDAELKKKLQAVGLPTSQDRKIMISRHKEYTLLYNADCDSEHPKTATEIARQVEDNEKLKNKRTVQATDMRLKVEKNSSSSTVLQAQQVYKKQHKNQFAELIAATKQRMKEQKLKKLQEAGNSEGSAPRTEQTDITNCIPPTFIPPPEDKMPTHSLVKHTASANEASVKPGDIHTISESDCDTTDDDSTPTVPSSSCTTSKLRLAHSHMGTQEKSTTSIDKDMLDDFFYEENENNNNNMTDDILDKMFAEQKDVECRSESRGAVDSDNNSVAHDTESLHDTEPLHDAESVHSDVSDFLLSDPSQRMDSQLTGTWSSNSSYLPLSQIPSFNTPTESDDNLLDHSPDIIPHSPPPPPKRRSRRQASNKTDPALIIGNVEDSNTRVTRRSMRNSQKNSEK